MKRRPKEHDAKSIDGVFSEGWRMVRKAGYVQVAHLKLQHPELLKHVGEDVFCRVTDYWFRSVECFIDSRETYPDGPNYICEATLVSEPRKEKP